MDVFIDIVRFASIDIEMLTDTDILRQGYHIHLSLFRLTVLLTGEEAYFDL